MRDVSVEALEDSGRQAGRVRWQGAAAALAILALLVGLLVYGRQSIHESNLMRAHAALANSKALAASAAQALDERAAGLEAVVGGTARGAGLAAALATGRGEAARRDLAAAQADAPSLLGLALYDARGARLASTSGAAPRQLEPHALAAMAAAGRVRPVRLPGDGAVMLVPARVGAAGTAQGYLVGWSALDPRTGTRAANPAGAAAEAGHALYVLDAGGAVCAAWGARDQVADTDISFSEPLELARQSGTGSVVVLTPDVLRRRLVGYAASPRTGLTVLATHRAEHALAPSRYLVARLWNMAVPTAALVVVAGWALFLFYYRERQLARDLAAHNARLGAEARAGSDLLANVSHDLRTPIAALRISISGLLDPEVPWDPAGARESLEMARVQVDQLAARVRNLLEMARLESGRQAMSTELRDLTDVVDCALDRLRPMLAGRPIDVEFPDQPILLECDQVQVESVVVNLLENALKYTPPGTPLHLAGCVSGGSARFSVRDEGPGLPSGAEERVFEKFYRGPDTGPAGGVGLGLAICKSIIERHGGAIGARSRPEGGAEFWFTLPMPLIEMAAPTMMEVAR